MLEEIKKTHPLQLMKNGIYYIQSQNRPVLNYLELLDFKGTNNVFKHYISYRLDSTGIDVAQEAKNYISERIYQGLLRFQQKQKLIANIENDKDWLYLPTFLLLSQGGDDRSLIDPHKLKNKYHTSTLPYYDYQRSSCTSSSISLETYLQIEQYHFELMAKNAIGILEAGIVFNNQKEEILSYFINHHLRSTISIMTCPSGTDVEFLCTWAGVLRHAQIYPNAKKRRQVCVFINGDLEVGSGTKIAAGLKHFNTHAPSGVSLEKNTPVFADKDIEVETKSFLTRDEKSAVLNSKMREESIYNMVKEQVENHKVVVFHFVHASKTGVSIPSFDLVNKLMEDFGQHIIMIVDAAQMRLKSDSIELYLESGMNVIVTGSKFIGGPPFSGALLVNQKDSLTFKSANISLPKEFDVYFDKNGTDKLVNHAPDSLAWNNWGLFLRWEVALHEMKQFDRIPLEFSHRFIEEWEKRVLKILEQAPIELRILKENTFLPDDNSSLSTSNSIIAFEVISTPLLTQEQLKHIHAQMSSKRNSNDIICEIGQPVQISTGDKKRFALRVALGAKNVIDAYRGSSSYQFDDCLNYLIANDEKILKKLFELIQIEVGHGNHENI